MAAFLASPLSLCACSAGRLQRVGCAGSSGGGVQLRFVAPQAGRGQGFGSAKGRLQCKAQVYKVDIEHKGEKHVLEVSEDETLLSKALEAGLEVPYDCRLGVCMTCPARLQQGEVDQSEGMLSQDVVDKGYTLMCVAYPRSDCSILTIPEEELLSLQLATAGD